VIGAVVLLAVVTVASWRLADDPDRARRRAHRRNRADLRRALGRRA